MKEVFPLNTSSNYNIKNRLTFHLRPVDSVYDITESISGLAPKNGSLFLMTSKHFTLCLS